MDLVVKGRGIQITDQIRRAADHKLAKIERLNPRILRLEVEIIGDLNPRTGGRHRVRVACDTARRTFHAEASADDVESALDQVTQRLERQISSYRGRLRARLTGRRNRLQSSRTSTDGSSTSE